jgi:hypothetical protein
MISFLPQDQRRSFSFLENSMSYFKPEELITKKGKQYPIVGGRLRIAHENNSKLSITTELHQFVPNEIAIVQAHTQSEKGDFSAYGTACFSKDERLADALLELAETRAIARALRFAGYGVEYTSSEEIPTEEPSHHQTESQLQDQNEDGATRPQIHAIEKISTLKGWDALECCRKILKRQELINLHSLSKNDASEVISRMKEVA